MTTRSRPSPGAILASGWAVFMVGSTMLELTATAPVNKTWLAVVKCAGLLNAAPEIRAGYHTVGRVVSFVLQGTWQ